MKTLNDYMAMSYRMEIVEDKDEGGFVVSYPDLPGCITCGETVESAVANALDAKRAWLEAALEISMAKGFVKQTLVIDIVLIYNSEHELHQLFPILIPFIQSDIQNIHRLIRRDFHFLNDMQNISSCCQTFAPNFAPLFSASFPSFLPKPI